MTASGKLRRLAGVALAAALSVTFWPVAAAPASAADASAPGGRLVVLWKHANHGALAAQGGIAESRESTAGSRLSVVVAKPGEAASVAARLRADPDVQAVVPDAIGKITAWPDTEPNDPGYDTYQTDLRLIGMPTAWRSTVGSSSIKVAIIDTGADLGHPDLAGLSVVAPWNEIYGTAGNAAVADDNGHGTHVLGTIAAQTNNAIGVAGIAPHVSVMPIKALNASGYGYWGDFDSSVDWAVAHGARVISMSLGGVLTPDQASLFSYSFDNAYAHGVTVVAAAGNDNSSEPFYPADFDHVISVAATTNDDARAAFSNYNDAVDIAAPGVSIVSTAPCALVSTCYASMSGTSMAAPHVSAVAALRLSLHPAETPDQVEQALERSSIDLGASGRDPSFGWGRLDAAAALAYQPPGGPVAGILPLAPVQSSTPFTVQWAGVGGGASITSYDVQASIDGAAYADWLTGTTATSAGYAGAAEHGYAFRVRAHDANGGVSAYDVTNVWQDAAPALGPGGFAAALMDLIRVRATPALAADVVATLGTGQLVEILDGPVAADGYEWYQVEAPVTSWGPIHGGVTGWAAMPAEWFKPVGAPNTTFVGVAVSAEFTYPASGTTTVTTSTSNTVSWTESGPVASRSLVEEAAPMTTAGSCAGLTWKTVWTSTTWTTPLALVKFSPGYCFRWRLTVTSAEGTSTTVTSGSLLIGPLPTAVFTYPRPGATTVTYNTSNSVKWTTSGRIFGTSIVEQYAYTTSGSKCTSAAWKTAWTKTGVSSPLALTKFSRSYCWRWGLTLTSPSGAKVTVWSGSLLVHR